MEQQTYTQTQDLVVLQPKTVAQYQEPYVDETGLSDTVTIKPANLLLVQNSTIEKGNARPGQILDTLTGEVYDSITVVPLRVSKARVLFPPGAAMDAEPVCRSNDGLVPSPFAAEPQSRKCSTCPHSQWINGKKPPCAEKRRLLVIVKDSGLPRYFQVGGKSISTLTPALQRIQEAISMQKAASDKAVKEGKDPLPELHLYDFFFTISTEHIKGKYSYYIARFDGIKRVASVGDFGPLFSEYVLSRKYQQQEDEEVENEVKTNAAVNNVIDAEFVQEV